MYPYFTGFAEAVIHPLEINDRSSYVFDDTYGFFCTPISGPFPGRLFNDGNNTLDEVKQAGIDQE